LHRDFGLGVDKKINTGSKIGTILLIVGSLSNYFAFECGQVPEDQIEESHISETYGSIHDHDEAGEIAIMFTVITGGLSF
jgi:hypothetical protein